MEALTSLMDAFNPARTAEILARCTVYPWIVEVRYALDDGAPRTAIHVVQATLREAPDPESFLPAGAVLLRADVFPGPRFDDMGPAQRQRYATHYREYLLWRKARALGLTAAQLQALPNFDAACVDGPATTWVLRG